MKKNKQAIITLCILAVAAVVISVTVVPMFTKYSSPKKEIPDAVKQYVKQAITTVESYQMGILSASEAGEAVSDIADTMRASSLSQYGYTVENIPTKLRILSSDLLLIDTFKLLGDDPSSNIADVNSHLKELKELIGEK